MRVAVRKEETGSRRGRELLERKGRQVGRAGREVGVTGKEG